MSIIRKKAGEPKKPEPKISPSPVATEDGDIVNSITGRKTILDFTDTIKYLAEKAKQLGFTET